MKRNKKRHIEGLDIAIKMIAYPIAVPIAVHLISKMIKRKNGR